MKGFKREETEQTFIGKRKIRFDGFFRAVMAINLEMDF